MTSALMLVAHGSRDPRHAATVAAIADRVRARRPDLAVAPAFLDFDHPGARECADVLAAGGASDVVAVPLLLTSAFHDKVDLPAVLRDDHGVEIRRSAVLGPSRLLVRALERRLAEAGVRRADRASTGLVLAAAGSTDPEAVAVIRRIARVWAGSGWRAVLPAFATGSSPTGVPAPEDAVRALRADGVRRVAVARYVICPGRLSDRIEHGAAGADVVAAELGDAPELVRLVLDRYRTTARLRPRAAGTTSSGSSRLPAADPGGAAPPVPLGRR